MRALLVTVMEERIYISLLCSNVLPHLKGEFCACPYTPAAFWNGDSRWRFLIMHSYLPGFQG